MKKLLILFFLISILKTGEGQTFVAGVLKDTADMPIRYASVHQVGTDRTTFSDHFGGFHLTLDDSTDQVIEVFCKGYFSEAVYAGNAKLPLEIILQENNAENPTEYKPPHQRRNPARKRRGFTIYANIDAFNDDFDNFESILGGENVETLNRVAGIFSVETAVTVKRRHYGFLAGLVSANNNNNPEQDSIKIDLTNTVYGLNFGYKIIDSRRFSLMPKVDVKWYRYRLLNYQADQISLSNFVEKPDLDLKISQPVGVVGASAAYKFRNKEFLPNRYWTIGAYAGYLFKLKNNADLNGKRSPIAERHAIRFGKLNFGFFMSANIDAGDD